MSDFSKGVRAYQEIVNYFLALDRSRGISYWKLSKLYKLDEANVYKRINGYYASQATNNGKHPFSRNPPIIRNPETGRFVAGKSHSTKTKLGDSV